MENIPKKERKLLKKEKAMVDINERELIKIIGIILGIIIFNMYFISFIINTTSIFMKFIILGIGAYIMYRVYKYLGNIYEIHYLDRKIYKYDKVVLPKYNVPDPLGYRKKEQKDGTTIISKKGVPYVSTKGDYIIDKHLKPKEIGEKGLTEYYLVLRKKENGERQKVQVTYEEYCTYLNKQHVFITEDNKLYLNS